MTFLLGQCCFKLQDLLCGSEKEEFATSSAKSNQPFEDQAGSSVTDLHRTSEQRRGRGRGRGRGRRESPVRLLPIETDERRRRRRRDDSIVHSSFSDHSTSDALLVQNLLLIRRIPTERLGLTLCYSFSPTSTLKIFIQQIDVGSVANEHGELCIGDEIVRINGQRPWTREEAIQLVNSSSRVHLQIVRYQFVEKNFSNVLTEDDSGVMVAYPTDLDPHRRIRRDLSLSWSALNSDSVCLSSLALKCRPCRSLSDLSSLKTSEKISFFPQPSSMRSESLFAPLTDHDEFILKPLPYRSKPLDSLNDTDSGLVCQPAPPHWTMKNVRRRYREQRLKEQYQSMLTTDDEPMSELKQGRYWTRQQRKEHLIKAKEYRQRAKFFQQHQHQQQPSRSSPLNTTHDFNLLNRIFLRENEREFQAKPHLATKYYQQSSIERKKLKQILRDNYFPRLSSQSNLSSLSHSTVLL